MTDIDAQERVRLSIERQFVVLVHTYHELVDVKLALAEDECIVDKQDNEGGFLLCDLVEQAVVHVAHGVPFFYTEWAKLFKSEKYLSTPIDHFYRVNEEATINFNPTEWLDLYNHTDPKTIPAQKGTERSDRPAVRDDDRAPRNGKRDYPDRDAHNRHDADRNKKPRRDASPPIHQKPDGRQHRRAPPPPRQTPAPASAASADIICIRNLFHHADPVAFKLPCTRKPCPRDHNPMLRNGKLEEADKKAVRANLPLMEGKFATLALQQLDVLF